MRSPDVEQVEEKEDPFNLLLVGSDSREGLTEAEQQALGADDIDENGNPITGERADTLIVAHIDPETDHVTMVQFPRDYFVEHADGEMGKINEALIDSKSELVRDGRAGDRDRHQQVRPSEHRWIP